MCLFLRGSVEYNQPKISRHLAYLRKAGVVSARRDGKWIHYRIVQPPHKHNLNPLREVAHRV